MGCSSFRAKLKIRPKKFQYKDIYLPITKMVNWSHFKNWLQLPIYFGLLSLADFFFTSLQCLVNNLHPSLHPETHTSILWVERTATSHTAAASFSLIASPIPPLVHGEASVVVEVVLVFFQLWFCTFYQENCSILVITARTKGPSSYCRAQWILFKLTKLQNLAIEERVNLNGNILSFKSV